MKITWYTLQDLADAIEAKPYPNYSGRAMYGRLCAGIKLDDDSDLLALGAAIAETIEDDGLRTLLLRSVRLDSMGRGIIAYWQTISCDDCPEDYED